MNETYEARLRIVEAVVAVASRHDFSDPQTIVQKCRTLEKYVLSCESDEDLPDSSPRRKSGRPKRITENDAPSNQDPTHGG